jgi:hypothetical protein
MNKKKCIVLFILLLPLKYYSITLPGYFDTLYVQNQKGINNSFSGLYTEICRELKIDPDIPEIKKDINSLLFYHQLLTTTDAVDCTKGGILQTVYFWHWTNPNPRHEIRLMPDSVLLVKIPSIKKYGRYKSYADIDRLPEFYLSDLVSDFPKYFHPSCGTFYTFGWCSEREMAFNALLKAMNFSCKIKQEGIHVWSEVLLEYTNPKLNKKYYVITLDNTFNSVNCYTCTASINNWKKDFGSGSRIVYYNRVSSKIDQIKSIESIGISAKAKKRIELEIAHWLLQNESATNGIIR